MDIVINHLNFNSRHYDKYKIALKFIPLVATNNLFSLEVLQIMPTLCNPGKLENTVYFDVIKQCLFENQPDGFPDVKTIEIQISHISTAKVNKCGHPVR